MTFLEKIALKKKIANEIDMYMKELQGEVRDNCDFYINREKGIFRFQEITDEGTIEFDVDIKSLYKECAELIEETNVRECISDYLCQCYYEKYTEISEDGKKKWRYN